MTAQIQNTMVNKTIALAILMVASASLFGQGRITWDSREDRSRVLLYYPATEALTSSSWLEEIGAYNLKHEGGKSLEKVSGKSEFYVAPYTGQPRHGLKLDTTTLITKDFSYTGDSLSLYFALRVNADQDNAVSRIITLMDSTGLAGDNNSLSVWLNNSRLAVSANGKLTAGSSKFLHYKTYLTEIHVNKRGSTIVLDGDTLYHNRSFKSYNFNINTLVLGSEYLNPDNKPTFSPSYSENIERMYIEGVGVVEINGNISEWTDQSGNGYDASIIEYGTVALQKSNTHGLNYDGVDDYMLLTSPQDQTDATVFSVIEPRYEPTDPNRDGYIFGYSTAFGGTAPWFHPRIFYDSALQKVAFSTSARIQTSPSVSAFAWSDTIYDVNKSYIITNVFDESDSLHLYINGDSVASVATDGTWAGTTNAARLGDHQEGAADLSLKGNYRMLIWYTTKLTPAQIDTVEAEINEYLNLYGQYAAQSNYANDVIIGDLMITEGPVDWAREAFNEKYHSYEDIPYESLTSIADSHPVKLLLDMTKLDAGRFNFVNDGRHTQSNYYYGLWDTISTSDLVGLKWNFTPGAPGYSNISEDSRGRTVHFNGEWLPFANGTSSYYYSYAVDGASVGNATSFTFLSEWGMAFADNNPQSQIWPNGIYWYEDPDLAWLPNYTHINNTSRNASPYQGQSFFDLPYDSLRISGYVGRYYDSDNTELRIFHNKATGPLVMGGVDIFNNSFSQGIWWVRSTPNNLFFPFRWSKLVGFDGQMKWRESSYLMHNWDRIDFTNQVDKPVSQSFIHEYEASSDYLTVKAGTDTLSVWQDKMGRIDIVDTTVVGYTNNVIGVATVDTINWNVECREEKSFYIPFDSSWQYKNVNVYIVMEDLSNGSDSNWIGLIHTNTVQETNQALLRWNHYTGGIAYQLGSYANGTSTTGEEYFKAAHLNYYDYEYWPRRNLDGATGNKYAITIDDDRFKGDAKVTFDSMANRKQIVMLEGVNTAGWSGISMSWVAGNVSNGNFDIKHVIVTHGEENPRRVFSYLRDKYYDWLDDPYYMTGTLDPNAEDYLVSYDISELIDTSLYPVGAYFDFDDIKEDYGNAIGARVKNGFDRVSGYAQSTGVGGNPDYYLRSRNMLGESVTAMGYNTSSYSFGRWNWQGAITDTSYTVLTTIKAIDFGTSNVEGFMSLITGNSSIGAWWNTSGSTSDQARLRVNGVDKWTWSGMDDTLSVIGFSINKNSALKGVRYLAGETTNTWFQKNYSAASATIDFDPGSYAITMAADPRGGNGTPGIDYYDKFILLDGALGEADLKLVTKFYPKLRIDQYPPPEILPLRSDLIDDAVHIHNQQWGRRQDNSAASNISSVRWWYNYTTGLADIQQGTEDDRPTSIKTGGVYFDGNDHMDITNAQFEGTEPGHCACVAFEFTDTTASTLYLWDISSGSLTNGDDFYHAMRANKDVGNNSYSLFSNYRDEPTVYGISARMSLPVDTRHVVCHNLDEDGWAEVWLDGLMVNKDALDGSFYGADDNKVFGSKRISETEQFTGNMYGITLFDRNLNREEMKAVNDSLMNHYNVTPKTMPDISFNPFAVWNPKSGVLIDGNGVRTIPDLSDKEAEYTISQSTGNAQPAYTADGYVDFDGVDDVMEVSSTFITDYSDLEFTVSVVFELDTATADSRFFTLSNGDNQFFRLNFNNNIVNVVNLDNHPATSMESIKAYNVDYDVPHILTAAGSETGTVEVWFDGVLIGSVPTNGSWDGITGTVGFYLGANRNGTDNYADFTFMHATWWEEKLTPYQVAIVEAEILTGLNDPELNAVYEVPYDWRELAVSDGDYVVLLTSLTAVEDSIGNVQVWNDLTNVNDFVQGTHSERPVISGDGIIFDGVDDYLEGIANFLETYGDDEFTMTMVYSPDTGMHVGPVMQYASNAATGPFLNFTVDSLTSDKYLPITAVRDEATSGYLWSASGPILKANTTAVFTASADEDGITNYYYNGIKFGTYTNDGGWSGTGENVVNIGASRLLTDFFKGSVQHFEISDYAMNDSQVQTKYELLSSLYSIDFPYDTLGFNVLYDRAYRSSRNQTSFSGNEIIEWGDPFFSTQGGRWTQDITTDAPDEAPGGGLNFNAAQGEFMEKDTFPVADGYSIFTTFKYDEIPDFGGNGETSVVWQQRSNRLLVGVLIDKLDTDEAYLCTFIGDAVTGIRDTIAVINQNEWYNVGVALGMDASYSVVINGELRREVTLDTIGGFSSNTNYVLGSWSGGTTVFLDGQIINHETYLRKFSNSELAQKSNNLMEIYDIAVDSSVLNYAYDGSLMMAAYKPGVGQTLSGSEITQWNDQSGNGNHLTVGGANPDQTAEGYVLFDAVGDDELLVPDLHTGAGITQDTALSGQIAYKFITYDDTESNRLISYGYNDLFFVMNGSGVTGDAMVFQPRMSLYDNTDVSYGLPNFDTIAVDTDYIMGFASREQDEIDFVMQNEFIGTTSFPNPYGDKFGLSQGRMGVNATGCCGPSNVYIKGAVFYGTKVSTAVLKENYHRMQRHFQYLENQ
jgi:hypothetical protein